MGQTEHRGDRTELAACSRRILNRLSPYRAHPQRRPRTCVQVEPTNELQEDNSLFDYVAARFSLARNWLLGFFPWLMNLELQGTIDIPKVRRTIGAFYHDGCSIVVSLPTGRRISARPQSEGGSHEVQKAWSVSGVGLRHWPRLHGGWGGAFKRFNT